MPLIGFSKSFTNFAKPVAAASSSGLLRGRPVIDLAAGTVLSAERTRLRGITMALDGPGSIASTYTLNRANWQKYRDLNLNLVRVPFSVEYENNTLNSMLPDMDAAVANASATGMYCMFMLDGAYGAANYDEFERVWPTVAARYKDNTNVFFEMNNEPHWSASEFGSTEYDRVVRVYNLIRTAAPNTLIGMITPASLETGGVNAVNELKSRGVTFGPAFFATHAYGNYSDSQFTALKAVAPVLMTETVSGGPGSHANPNNETYKILRMEALGIGWMALQARFGEVSNVDTPYSNDETSFTGRIRTELINVGSYNWPQDSIVSAKRALPAGMLFDGRTTLGAGVSSIGLPGAVAGKVFAVASAFAKGNAVGVAGSASLPHSITLSPANPGSIQQTSAGAAVVWNTTASAVNITAGISWAIIGTNGVQRGATTTIPNTNSNYTISASFIATGEKLRVWETGNTAINKDSGTVTVIAAARNITISPMTPGSFTGTAVVATTINTTAISNITYVVVDADYGWRSGQTSVAVNPAGDSKTVNVTYTTNGQFLKVFDTSDAAFKVDANAVVIQAASTPIGNGFYEGFDNNTTGQLGHIWGNRGQLSVNNGILRLQGLAGQDPWANACGVMVYPGGANYGFGYGLYEMRIRQADFIGDGSGGCALLWPADDVWPGAEEDMGEITADGEWYPAHHWKGPNDSNGNPTDRFEYFAKPGFNPTSFFISGCRIKRDYLEFLVNGVVHATTRNNVTRVYGDGVGGFAGMNRVPGIMNRSSNTWIECDWIKYTPEGPT